MVVNAGTETSFTDTVKQIAEIAAAHADEVDRDARFPREAIDALRDAGALSALVPEELGGGGASISEVARACRDLGRGCSATGMVFAMHQIQVATMTRHLTPGSWFETYLESLCRDQRLISSATSEIGTGGDMGRSIAAVTPIDGGRLMFEKRAPTVSYGAYSDDILTTVRRAPGAESSDQVMVLHATSETDLEPVGVWDTLGMRGTCSPGFTIRAEFGPERVLEVPFSTMMQESIVPLSHIFWSHLWLGIATEAFERGRSFVRASARSKPGEPVPAAHQLAGVMAELTMLRGEVEIALQDFLEQSAAPEREPLSTLASVLRFNNLKLAASEQAPRICMAVLETIGIMGYKNDSPYGVGRQLRDSLSARLMVANERIRTVDASLLMIAKEV
jgi:acyl-CoA dehydrogenase